MKTIGLTGGLGSGKSTAATILAQLGAEIIDADRVGHAIYAPNTQGWERVVASFGPEIVAADGTIDRKRLGAIVFADPARLARLNALVHPLMADEIRSQIEHLRARRSQATIVVEAAVLIEARWHTLVDEVWLVVAKREAVLARVQAQRQLDPVAIQARLDTQLSDEARRSYAHVVIDNSGSIGELRAQLEHLWQERCQ